MASRLVLIVLLAGTVVTLQAQTATRQISKNYKVGNDFTLGVDNTYGEINIINWDRNEVDVTVTIETEAGSQSKADALLKDIEIDISESKSSVYFETEIGSDARGRNKKVQVTYEVKAPVSINVSLEQKYGNIYIQEIAGVAVLEVKYGGLTAGALSHIGSDKWNTLELAYGSADIDYVTTLTSEVRYSEFTVGEAAGLEVESAYSKLFLGELGELVLESKYDKVNVKQISGSLSVESAYTQVSVDRIMNGFTEISADMAYGNFKAGLDSNPAFAIDAEVNYGSIRIPDGEYSMEKQGSNEEVHGRVGANTRARIQADLKYGNLELD